MKYEETVNIEKSEYERINRLLEIPSLEEMTDKELIDAGANTNVREGVFDVTFKDGSHITYDLCSGISNYWDDVVFSNDMYESVVECTFSLDDIELEEDGNIYTVHINII